MKRHFFGSRMHKNSFISGTYVF